MSTDIKGEYLKAKSEGEMLKNKLPEGEMLVSEAPKGDMLWKKKKKLNEQETECKTLNESSFCPPGENPEWFNG